MSAGIVGVHGIWNLQRGKSPAEAAKVLSSRWTAALRRGLGQYSSMNASVSYYSHHLASEAAQGISDPEYLDEPEQEMLLRWASELGAPGEIAQGRLTQPARAAAEWIACRFGLDSRLVKILASSFCREVYCYLSDPSRRGRVRNAVAETIAATRPRVVIGHSLGSVVAYETLWARPDLPVELFLTVGSPLALPDVVFPKLEPTPSKGRGQRPPWVRHWVNVSDSGDFVAIPRKLSDYFDGVDADLTTPIGVFDMHKVSNYLACTTTAAALATSLGREDSSPI